MEAAKNMRSILARVRCDRTPKLIQVVLERLQAITSISCYLTIHTYQAPISDKHSKTISRRQNTQDFHFVYLGTDEARGTGEREVKPSEYYSMDQELNHYCFYQRNGSHRRTPTSFYILLCMLMLMVMLTLTIIICHGVLPLPLPFHSYILYSFTKS